MIPPNASDHPATPGPGARLLVIVGPTAVGKTALSIRLAQRLGGEIISGDSMQVYRGMDIGTAKPTLEERAGIPHHLIDIVNPDEPFSVAQFQRLADTAIAEITARGRLPILVGGTGLYTRAVLEAYTFGEGAGADLALRAALQAEEEANGPGHLHRRLTAVDPEAAARLHPNDLRRIIRALEVFLQSGIPISAQQTKEAAPLRYAAVQVGLFTQREALYDRINRRVDLMLEAGWLAEVEGLLARYSPELPAMRALGYLELTHYLRGRLTRPEAVALIQRNTRRFAKRQLTWYRRERRIHWYDPVENSQERVASAIGDLLAGDWQKAVEG